MPGRLGLGVSLHGIHGCLHFLESLLRFGMAILVRVELLRQFAVELGEIRGLHVLQSRDQHVLRRVQKLKHQEHLFLHSGSVLGPLLLNISFGLLRCLLVNLSLNGRQTTSQLLWLVAVLIASVVVAARLQLLVHLSLSIGKELLLLSSTFFPLLFFSKLLTGFDLFSIFLATG